VDHAVHDGGHAGDETDRKYNASEERVAAISAPTAGRKVPLWKRPPPLATAHVCDAPV
jgi:hypothetical protein